MNLLSLAEELKAKVRALAEVPRARSHAWRRPAPVAARPLRRAPRRRAEVVVDRHLHRRARPRCRPSSRACPPASPRAVLVVQHMPRGLHAARWPSAWTRAARLPVREAEDGERVAAGPVLIAPAGPPHEGPAAGAGTVRVWLDDEPRAALHRPSVDVLMASVARVYGARRLGVVLTGMGSDGVEGLRAIREAGGRTLAESEETCVIYGMPKAAVEAGVVDRSVPLGRMADEILAAV